MKDLTEENLLNFFKKEYTAEELRQIEAHRKASPFKVGCEPDYDKIIPRVPRKIKKKTKAFYVKNNIAVSTFAFALIKDRFKDKRQKRRINYDLSQLMKNLINHGFYQNKL